MTKTPVPIFHGRVENGRILLEQREKFAAQIGQLEGKDIEITLTKHRRKRSLSQNSYYWAVVVAMIQEASGYETPEETHDALRWHFLQTHPDEALPSVASTTSLNTAEMAEYIEKCRRLAAQMFGISIPDPQRAAELGMVVAA